MKLNTKLLNTDDGINYLNSGLMVISAIMAFFIPFHLFLFVYAVLGPLHYLTEISWLEKRNFFILKKQDILVFGALCLILFLSFFIPSMGNYNTALIMLSVVFAILALLIKNNLTKYVVTIITFFLLARYFPDNKIAENNNFNTVILFGILLPTLIHVYVFTALFITTGALKQNKFSGYFSLIVLLFCTSSFAWLLPEFSTSVSGELRQVFDQFKWMNRALLYLLGQGGFENAKDVWTIPDSVIYTHPSGIACMRFIAFAYTYHYLNWFSKTSVIKWHEVSKKRMFTILGLWILSVTLYAVNYKIGFYALFFLSMLHVMCEFPLNIISIQSIGTSIRSLVK